MPRAHSAKEKRNSERDADDENREGIQREREDATDDQKRPCCQPDQKVATPRPEVTRLKHDIEDDHA